MIDVKAYQDGERFVMVFENCTPDVKKLLTALINPIMEKSAEVSPVEKEIIFTGEGNGISLSELLNKRKDRGYMEAAKMLDQLNEEDKKAAEEQLKTYFKERFSDVLPYDYAGKLSERQCGTFFKQFEYATKPYESKIAEQSGFVSFEEFLKNAPLNQKQSAVGAIIEKNQ